MAARSTVSPRSIAAYESGDSSPTPRNLDKLAAALEVSPLWLLGGEEVLRDAPAPRGSLLRHVSDTTLQKNLEDLVKRLASATAVERKHILGGLREILDELDERELNCDASRQAIEIARKHVGS